MKKFDLTNIKAGSPVGTKKMHIDGETRAMDVYKIPLDMLYYNDQNDRIATYISKYNSVGKNITSLETDEYNKQIEEYIIASDKARFNQTKNNIEEFGQMVPGVVLNDGRVIDGNRRFTALRNLHRESGNQKFNYFEAVILDGITMDKQIKIMELILQQGAEERVDYNPIEKLVGIYRDVVKNNLISINEYADSIGAKKKDVEKSVELAKLMEDFLEYINAPEEFYIAKELKIDGPLNEIYNIKKRVGQDNLKWNKTKVVLYDNLIMKTKNDSDSQDITRNIREFGKKVINKPDLFDNYCEEHEALSRKLAQKINDCPGEMTASYIINTIRADEELSDEISKKFNDSIYEGGKDDAKKAPVDDIKSINNDINKIDKIVVSRMSNEDKQTFKNELDKTLELIEKLRNIIENE